MPRRFLLPAFVRRSVGRRLAVAISGAALAVSVAGYVLLRAQERTASRHTAEEFAQVLARAVETAFPFVDPTTGRHPVERVIERLAALPTVGRVHVLDDRGRVAWSSDAADVGARVPGETVERLARGESWLEDAAHARDVSRLVAPLPAGAGCRGCHIGQAGARAPMFLGGVAVELRPVRVQSELVHFRRYTVAGFALFILVASGLLLRLVRQHVQTPLRRLSRVMARAREGDFLVRAPVEGDDEVGTVTADLNAMLAKITDLKVNVIEGERELQQARREIELHRRIEEQSQIIQETNDSLQRRLAELSLLFETSRVLTATLDMDRELDGLVDVVTRTLALSGAVVMLAQDGALVRRAAHGRAIGPAGEASSRIALGEGLLGRAAASGKVAVALDGAGPGQPEDGAVVAIPMHHKGTLIGVLGFMREVERPFGDAELSLLRSVAEQTTLAIVNARLYERTRELSLTDDLTGLPNRRQLQMKLDAEWQRAMRFRQSFAVVMVDVDHFKRYNDAFGHLAGDAVLRHLAHVLSRSTRAVDTVARVGGEEFLVLLPRTEKAPALRVAEKLRRAVEQAFAHGVPGGADVPVTISLGAAAWPADADRTDALVDAADKALFAAKRAGRNRAVAYEPPDAERSRAGDRRPS